jgi:hypothetical protein
MERPLAHPALRACGWSAVLLGAMLALSLAAGAQPPDQSARQNSTALQEVQVTASKLDRRTLKRVAVQFLRLHAAVGPTTGQFGRWRMDVCPRVIGLDPSGSEYVSRHLTETAKRVGAPTPRVGKRCRVNIEVAFTPQPQQLLKQVAKVYPGLLGSARARGDTLFQHAIQSWYLTGTEFSGNMLCQMALDAAGVHRAADDATIDPAYGPGAACGSAASRLSKGLTSEFVNVLVIVDARKVAGDSLRSISDYVTMLALTRMSSLDGCNELPSITDLLSSGCGDREKPQVLTEADTAYLKALYSSDLGMNLNIELGDIRNRMVTSIMGR